MKKIVISVLRLTLGMGLTLLLSCTEDMGDGGLDKSPSSDYLTFSTTTEEEEDANINNTAATRGSQAKKSSLNSGFGISCSAYPEEGTYTSYALGSYFYNTKVVPNTPTAYYWPTADHKVSFFAYYPYGNTAFKIASSATAKGRPKYSYTVPSAISKQIDIMTAEKYDVSCATHTTVALSFKHRLADIRFSCTNDGAEAITLKSVSIYGVKYSGTLTNATWTLTGAANSSSVNPFTLSVEKTIAPGETLDVTGTKNHFIMLPQTVPSGTQIFDIYATVGGKTEHHYYTLTSDLKLTAGKSYNYIIKVSGEISVTTSILDWAPEEN